MFLPGKWIVTMPSLHDLNSVILFCCCGSCFGLHLLHFWLLLWLVRDICGEILIDVLLFVFVYFPKLAPQTRITNCWASKLHAVIRHCSTRHPNTPVVILLPVGSNSSRNLSVYDLRLVEPCDLSSITLDRGSTNPVI